MNHVNLPGVVSYFVPRVCGMVHGFPVFVVEFGNLIQSINTFVHRAVQRAAILEELIRKEAWRPQSKIPQRTSKNLHASVSAISCLTSFTNFGDFSQKFLIFLEFKAPASLDIFNL